eukprot:gnl/MRDRNA2_/MRDRNA2_116627_c0_seq1.p1 gnl/MRDRNA2_/MRDRNA2_116627_c0~~gnl/MRDRNA2_/MRDRNA2_116627_c0_seq1.p1  ORF type:complete len:244 (-),score=64.48 gnl/MRDRNA2_/MRDRNA2_116627_c0_seq1:24-755(-)
MGWGGKSKSKQRELAANRNRKATVEAQINAQLPEVQKGLIIFLMQQASGKTRLDMFKEEMYKLFEGPEDMSLNELKIYIDRCAIMKMAQSGLFYCPKGWSPQEEIMLSGTGRQYGTMYMVEVNAQQAADAQAMAEATAQAQAQAAAQAQTQAQAQALSQALAQDLAQAQAPTASSMGESVSAAEYFHALATKKDDEVDDQDDDDEVDDQDNMEHIAKKARLAQSSASEDEAAAPPQKAEEFTL